MNRQTDLFGPDGTPNTRTTDPLPSHAAGREIEMAGKAGSHRRRILRAIAAHPARNGRELAPLTGLEYSAMSKRLTELLRHGFIEHGQITTEARRWFATPRGRAALELGGDVDA